MTLENQVNGDVAQLERAFFVSMVSVRGARREVCVAGSSPAVAPLNARETPVMLAEEKWGVAAHDEKAASDVGNVATGRIIVR